MEMKPEVFEIIKKIPKEQADKINTPEVEKLKEFEINKNIISVNMKDSQIKKTLELQLYCMIKGFAIIGDEIILDNSEKAKEQTTEFKRMEIEKLTKEYNYLGNQMKEISKKIAKLEWGLK